MRHCRLDRSQIPEDQDSRLAPQGTKRSFDTSCWTGNGGTSQPVTDGSPARLCGSSRSWEDLSCRIDEICETLRGVDLLLRAQNEQSAQSETRYQQREADFRRWATEQAAQQDQRWRDSLSQVMAATRQVMPTSITPIRSSLSGNRAQFNDDSHINAGEHLTPSGNKVDGNSSNSQLPTELKTAGVSKGAVDEVETSVVTKSPESRKSLAVRSASGFISHNLKEQHKSNLSFWHNFVTGNAFGSISALMITINAVSIGVQTQWTADNRGSKEAPFLFRLCDVFFCVFFLLELLLRMSGERMHFFTSSQWAWNLFDFVVVAVSVIEEGFMLATSGESLMGNLTFLRVVRIFRLVRVLRVIRVLRFFKDLRLLVQSVMGSLKSLVWTILMIMLLLYVFGVFITQYVTDHLADARQLQDEDALNWEDELLEAYGSLFHSLYSLYRAMTGGIDWGDSAFPLVEGISPWFAVFYSLYIAFTQFAMLNVVTGIFVEHAMADAQKDRDYMIQETLAEKHEKAQDLEKLFMEADASGDGLLNMSELEDHFNDERVKAYLQSLELDVSSTRALFSILDSDGSGTVGIEEFLEGCQKLKGNVSSFDFAVMQIEQRRSFHQVHDQLSQVSKQLLQTLQMNDIVNKDVWALPKTPPASMPYVPASSPVENESTTQIQNRDHRTTASNHSIESHVRRESNHYVDLANKLADQFHHDTSKI